MTLPPLMTDFGRLFRNASADLVGTVSITHAIQLALVGSTQAAKPRFGQF